MSNKLGLAIAIAAEAFKDKTDKSGRPYILHCLWVMDGVKHLGDDVMIAAVLHDLVEDTDWTFSQLTDMGFSDKVIGILYLLTHDKNTPYDEYIKAISVSKEATAIKLKDLEHNSNISRLKGLRKKDFDRMEKYHRSYIYLSEL